MKIYTKTGDGGNSGLIGGERRPKSDALFEAVGSLDECNAAIGLALECQFSEMDNISSKLRFFQNVLFEFGAIVANPKFEMSAAEAARWEEVCRQLEAEMDLMSSSLPPLKNFILPGGSQESARLHYLRAVVRRCERSLVAIDGANRQFPEVLKCINRFSDWLFVAARFANHSAGVSDTIWTQ